MIVTATKHVPMYKGHKLIKARRVMRKHKLSILGHVMIGGVWYYALGNDPRSPKR